jgi:hypothetical protein
MISVYIKKSNRGEERGETYANKGANKGYMYVYIIQKHLYIDK